MNIALVEPFYSGSHKLWCDGLVHHSEHTISVHSLRGKYWKWRMTGGAIALSEQFTAESLPDAFLVSDMIDLALFRALLAKKADVSAMPMVLYFHENQLMYPWNSAIGIDEDRERHYAFINYTSALVADHVWFSSAFQKEGFLKALPGFLKAFPDHRNLEGIDEIAHKSVVVPVGTGPFPQVSDRKGEKHVIVWNHRHEHDKNPDAFFEVLIELSEEGRDFDLIVLGEQYQRSPSVFDRARSQLEKHVLHWGEVSRERYFDLLQKATLAPVTSDQDFFGISVLESAACGAIPVLPDRLVYPEHFAHTRARFYKSRDEFGQVLRDELQRPWTRYDDIVDAARQYTWDRVIQEYDRRLPELITK